MSTSTRTLAALATALLALCGAALVATPADAATIHRARSCWQELDTGRTLCVDASENLADAVLNTYGVVLETPDGAVAPSKAGTLATARDTVAPRTSTVIGVFYEDANYGGASFVASVTPNGCHGYSYGYASLAPLGWDNRITSFQSYSNCKTALFENDNYGGASYGYYVSSSNVGPAMNDQASSIRWAA